MIRDIYQRVLAASGKLVFAVFFTFLAAMSSAGQLDIGDASRELTEEIYDQSGILFDFHLEEDCSFGHRTGPRACIILYVKSVRPGSSADLSGLFSESFLDVGDLPRQRTVGDQSGTIYPEAVYRESKKMLSKFWDHYKWYDGVLYGRAWKLSEVLEIARNKKGFGYHKRDVEAVQLVLGKEAVEEFWGVIFDFSGHVLDVRADSLGYKFGFQVGDYLVDGNNLPPDPERFSRALAAFTPYWAQKSEHPAYVRRGEKWLNLGVPKFILLDNISPEFALSSLTVSEEKVFDEIPSLERNFFKAIYLGSFDRSIYEKKLIERASASALSVRILGENAVGHAAAELERARQESSRLEVLLARYAIIKSQTIGLCGARAAQFRITERWIRTLRNGFGITLSETIVKDEERFFEVEQRFGRFVADHEVSDQSVFLERGYAEFIRKAGGCESELISKFENNFLKFISYE
jgi:hypothetical protein